MPGSAHEVLIVALREQPSLLVALIAKLTGASLPRGLKPVDSVVRFVKTAEVRPDLLYASSSKRRKRWVIVELQGRPDPAKRRRWLLAASVLLDQTGALGDVVVITARRDVARWARRVAHLRGGLGTKLALTPIVLHLGPREVEALLDERRPELSLFAAWAMQNRHGPKARSVVERALKLTSRLPAPLRRAQMRAILSVLSERMLTLLREASMNPDKIPETAAGRRTRLFLEAQGGKRVLTMLREASMDPDKIPEAPASRKMRLFLEAQGRKRGRVEGEARGELKGKREALLAMLKARGLSVSAEQRATIRGCADLAKLDQWIIRAATASSTSQVLRPATRSNSERSPRRRPAGARSRAARGT